MAVISTRLGFHAQRARHVGMDSDSWNAMFCCRFWQSLGEFSLRKGTVVGKNQDDEKVQSAIQAIKRASPYSRVWGSIVIMPTWVFVDTRRDLENNLEGLVELGTVDMENVDLGGNKVPWGLTDEMNSTRSKASNQLPSLDCILFPFSAEALYFGGFASVFTYANGNNSSTPAVLSSFPSLIMTLISG
jgi:hypothetical protein